MVKLDAYMPPAKVAAGGVKAVPLPVVPGKRALDDDEEEYEEEDEEAEAEDDDDYEEDDDD